MSTITFTYTQPDDALTLERAIELGYKEMIVDESLFVDGKIPMVQAKDGDGELRFEMAVEWGPLSEEDPIPAIISETVKLDEDGNPKPVMEQMDVTIPNPQTAEEFMSIEAKAAVAELLVGGIEKKMVGDAMLEAEQIVKTAKATAKATKEAVADSIAVTIN